MRRELVESLLNGTVWGAIVGLFAFVFYASAGLGVVMSSAVVLNLVVAAVTGVAVPLLLHASGRDLAQGSSVLLTFVTDALGFFCSSDWRACSWSEPARSVTEPALTLPLYRGVTPIR